MKTWMKILMWCGLGGGIGFFAGWQAGQRSAYRKAYNEGYDCGYQSRRDEDYAGQEAAEDAMEDYRGADTDGDKSVFDEPNIETWREEEEAEPEDDEDTKEIEQLHPQSMMPELISAADYEINTWNYEREMMRYYSVDHALFNLATREIYKDPDIQDQIIGIGTISDLYTKWNSTDGQKTVYVRNDTEGKLYRIDYFATRSDDVLDGAFSPDYDSEEDTE